ncbi:hypothetical protein INN71_15150 [Nocardioides sp. ChNu-153]|uniref:hypothetical protein n=1 Tax=unclassified Nocardioides TaxID=2615069 RepID=UPI002405ACA6|nr:MULTISPECIES: hypothetical protein [unclassified Nocardioides]MDF9716312.1 hypothetical protein [Nocardioides sp. ChNu-99]MDN7122726.1 hypothetical protein [Nocardioides sp. ChNu-153]
MGYTRWRTSRIIAWPGMLLVLALFLSPALDHLSFPLRILIGLAALGVSATVLERVIYRVWTAVDEAAERRAAARLP